MIAQTVAWLQVAIMLIIMSYAAVILWKLIFMDLTSLICEPGEQGGPGKASLSRFQMLLFTFVIASLFMPPTDREASGKRGAVGHSRSGFCRILP